MCTRERPTEIFRKFCTLFQKLKCVHNYSHFIQCNVSVKLYHPPDSASPLLLDKIECLMNVGRMYLQKCEANKAIGHLKNALEQSKNSFLWESYFLHAKILYCLTGALKQDGKLTESLQYSLEAKKATDQISGSINARKLEALILKRMGGIYNELGRLPEAQKCIEDTLTIHSEMYEKNTSNKSVVRLNAAQACSPIAWSGDTPLKAKLTKAAKTYKEMPITNENECFRAVCNLFVLSTICENHGEQDEALEHLKEARNVAKANGYKHAVVVDVLYTLCEKYLDLHFFDEFIICVSEAIEMRKNCVYQHFENFDYLKC